MLNLNVPKVRLKPQEGEKWASVSVIVYNKTDELLLIKRTENPKDPWSGNIAMPGGHYEKTDADLLETAIRETYEEVGIKLSYESFVGVLNYGFPSNLTEIKVLPHVFFVDEKAEVKPNKSEVLYAFWLPLREKLEIVPYSMGSFYKGWAIKYKDEIIWGLTYRIIKDLLNKANIIDLP